MEKETFERMLAEFNELNEKTTKCRNFLLEENNSENPLDALGRDLLVSQLKAMEAYLSILSIRIGLNAPKSQIEEESQSTENAE